MPNINKHMIGGHLGKDPELRYIPSGTAVCTFSVAVNRKWKDKQSGEWKEATSWHQIVLYGKGAEMAAATLAKGDGVVLEGPSETREFQRKDGGKGYTTEIKPLWWYKTSKKADPAGQAPAPGNEAPSNNDDGFDDDVPF